MGRIKRGGGDGGDPVRSPSGWLNFRRPRVRSSIVHDECGRASRAQQSLLARSQATIRMKKSAAAALERFTGLLKLWKSLRL
jgi:hypothetical protein